MDDQIELLTQERNRDVRHVLDNLPVQEDPSATRVQEIISREPEMPSTPGESALFQAFLSGLSWATYVIAIAATLALTWASSIAFR